jgi:hypothetical protein
MGTGMGGGVLMAAALVALGGAPAGAASGEGESHPLAAASEIGPDVSSPPAMTGEPEPQSKPDSPAQSVAPRPEAAVDAIPVLPVRADEVTTDRGFPACALQLGGGVSEFSLGQMRSQAARGPYWDLRGIIGLRRIIALEAAIVGAAYPMASARFGSDAVLVRNGIEAGPRVNLPLETEAGLLLLYGTAGLGFANFRLARADNRNGMAGDDYAATVPLAAGITMGYERFLVDVRLGYRFTFRDQMASNMALPAAMTTAAGGTTENRLRDYSIGVQVGYEF